MVRLTADILDEFTANLDLSGEVWCIEVIGDRTLFLVPNTYHLRKGMPVYIDGVQYKAIEVNSKANTFQIEEIFLIIPSIYRVPNPYFFHGTPKMVNDRLAKLDYDRKLPFIYMYEVYRERVLNQYDPMARTSQVRLFFCDQINKRDWNTDDHYHNVLQGLMQLTLKFIESIQKDRKTFESEESTFETISRVNWGTFENDKGNVSLWFRENVTAVEMLTELRINKDCIRGIKRCLCSGDIEEESGALEMDSGQLLYYGEYK